MSSAIIERCMAILEVLSDHPAGLSLGAIAERTGIPKSATYRMLTALTDAGQVLQLANRDYKLTLRLPALGLRFLSGTNLVAECQPVLDALAARVGELVRLAAVVGDDLVWIAKAQGAQGGLVIDPVMGRRVVLHATATGKLWLSRLPRDEALRLARAEGLGGAERNGPQVIRDEPALLAELDRIAAQGYATADQEAEPGVSALAIAIAGPEGRTLATLSVAGPSVRLTEARRAELLPLLREARDRLSGLELLGPIR